jgi:tripartite-type tricarboxylate transporter receptor subunit TctC
LVVPFPPGGLIDNMARLIGPRLSQELGQPVVIDNKPGAGGNLGASDASRAAADGYTLLMASPPLTINPALYKKLPYQPEQIAPLGLLGRVPNVLMVNPNSGIQSVAELSARIKARPGQLNYASNVLAPQCGVVQKQGRLVHHPHPLSRRSGGHDGTDGQRSRHDV